VRGQTSSISFKLQNEVQDADFFLEYQTMGRKTCRQMHVAIIFSKKLADVKNKSDICTRNS